MMFFLRLFGYWSLRSWSIRDNLMQTTCEGLKVAITGASPVSSLHSSDDMNHLIVGLSHNESKKMNMNYGYIVIVCVKNYHSICPEANLSTYYAVHNPPKYKRLRIFHNTEIPESMPGKLAKCKRALESSIIIANSIPPKSRTGTV